MSEIVKCPMSEVIEIKDVPLFRAGSVRGVTYGLEDLDEWCESVERHRKEWCQHPIVLQDTPNGSVIGALTRLRRDGDVLLGDMSLLRRILGERAHLFFWLALIGKRIDSIGASDHHPSVFGFPAIEIPKAQEAEPS